MLNTHSKNDIICYMYIAAGDMTGWQNTDLLTLAPYFPPTSVPKFFEILKILYRWMAG